MTWREIFAIAGVVGVDPRPLTLRELWWMMHGRQKVAWAHTSAICAMIANAAPRGKRNRRKTYQPNDFSPYRTRAEDEMSFKALLKEMARGSNVKVVNGRSR